MLKKDCETTRRSLHKYLLGHLFVREQKKIDRHLKKCAFCSTEYQALRRSAETRKLLKDITPPEGVVQRVKAGVSVFSAFRKLLYRPLWVLSAVGAAVALYLYVIAPLYHDRELESIEAAAPQAVRAETPENPQPAPAVPAVSQPAPAAPVRDPLVVTITVEDEASAISRINEVMKGHAVLRSKRFSATEREISGNLRPKELLTFFHRIEDAGRVRYKGSILKSAPAAAALPFVLRLKTAPPSAPKPEKAEPSVPPRPAPAAPSGGTPQPAAPGP